MLGSGVQRLLDARGQLTRFLDALENILYSSRKISEDLFSRSPKFFTSFASVVKFHENSLLPWMPPSAASCPGNDIFYFFLGHLPTFLKKTGPLDAPQGGCPGGTVRTPLCTPLYLGIL